jgi:hypothetical protein
MPPVDKPNYTQIPNAMLDNMASMSGAALKVAIAVYYHEAAFDSDDAPLSRDRLQQMTGLDSSTLLGAIDDAVDGCWITRCAADGSVTT